MTGPKGTLEEKLCRRAVSTGHKHTAAVVRRLTSYSSFAIVTVGGRGEEMGRVGGVQVKVVGVSEGCFASRAKVVSQYQRRLRKGGVGFGGCGGGQVLVSHCLEELLHPAPTNRPQGASEPMLS